MSLLASGLAQGDSAAIAELLDHCGDRKLTPQCRSVGLAYLFSGKRS